MDRSLIETLDKAANTLKEGGVIAYPTESVFGLGCDPFNAEAITKILQLKHRSMKKGFIIIAYNWAQVESLVEPLEPHSLAQVFASWPGPVTWVFPASENAPMWLRGEHSSIAIRLTEHPIASAICQTYGSPIVSTSANIDGFPPARDIRTLHMTFGDKIDLIVPGLVGDLINPTEIRDAITGEVLREG